MGLESSMLASSNVRPPSLAVSQLPTTGGEIVADRQSCSDKAQNLTVLEALKPKLLNA
jgi:hypothetical protein